MSYHNPRRSALSKMSRFLRLLSHGVVCAHEAHGSSADLTTLEAEGPSHTHWGSFHGKASTGGVTISIKAEYVEQFNAITVNVNFAGGCFG